MTTDNQAFETPVTQETSDAPVVEKVTEEVVPDYKSKYEQAEAARIKSENDRKALTTSRMRQDERDRMMVDLLDLVTVQGKQLAALLKSRAPEDEDLARDVSRIQSETNEARQVETLKAEFEDAKEAFVQAMGDLDPQSPEFATCYETFNLSTGAGLSHEQRRKRWNAGIASVHQVVRAKERETLIKTHEAALESERKSKKRALEQSFDLDAGPGAGGGGPATPDDIDVLWIEYETKNPGKKNPYEAQYRELLGMAR